MQNGKLSVYMRSGSKVIWEKSTSGHATCITSNFDFPTRITANEKRVMVAYSATPPGALKNKPHDNGPSTSGSMSKPDNRDVTRSVLNHKEPGTDHSNVRVNKVIKVLGISLVLTVFLI